jgi:hypothetical protein
LICHPEPLFFSGEEPALSLSKGSQSSAIEILHAVQSAPFRACPDEGRDDRLLRGNGLRTVFKSLERNRGISARALAPGQ